MLWKGRVEVDEGDRGVRRQYVPMRVKKHLWNIKGQRYGTEYHKGRTLPGTGSQPSNFRMGTKLRRFNEERYTSDDLKEHKKGKKERTKKKNIP